jgi:hypothetical protein
MTVGMLAQNIGPIKVRRAVQLFLHRGAGRFPGNVEFLFTKRSRKHYLVSQTRFSPLGGMEDKNEAALEDAVILKRELQEEVLGINAKDHPHKFFQAGPDKGKIDPDTLTLEERKIYDIFENRVKAGNLELIHRELHNPDVKAWNPSVDAFYILKDPLSWREYRDVKRFLAQKNRLNDLENLSASGEASGFYKATVNELLEHTNHDVDGKKNILSMPPETHAFNRGLFYFTRKFHERRGKLIYAYRLAASLLRMNDKKSLYPYSINYKSDKFVEREIINSDGLKVKVMCRELDEKNQPAFDTHAVLSHSRGIRFIEIAKEDGFITIKEGIKLPVKKGQVIATAMEFTEKGALIVMKGRTGLPDVYLPDEKEVQADGTVVRKPLMIDRDDRIQLFGYEPMSKENYAYNGEAYKNSELNGIYIRNAGRNYMVLPEPVKVPTLVGEIVALEGDRLIRRFRENGTLDNTIEVMEKRIFEQDVMAMPRHFDNAVHRMAIRRNNGAPAPSLDKLKLAA